MKIDVNVRTQKEIFDALNDSQNGAVILTLDKISKDRPLMTQISRLMDNPRYEMPNHKLKSKSGIVGYYSEEPLVMFILNDDDIFLNALQVKLKEKIEMSESNIIFKEDELDVDYKLREKVVVVESNGREFKVYPDKYNNNIEVIENVKSPAPASKPTTTKRGLR